MNTTDLQLTHRRARKLYRGKAMRNTYVRGAIAADKGKPASACPYAHDPGKTWRQAYRKAWLRGYDSVGPVAEG